MPSATAPDSIDPNTTAPDGSDWQSLVDEGTTALHDLVGEAWTDFNTHDPGVTLLETLSYALTDLSYRIAYPIQDLITDAAGNMDLAAACFYTPPLLFPTAPITLLDLRKVVLDQLTALANVWLVPTTDPALAGRYLVWLLPASGSDGTALTRSVEQCLSRYRSLGDVFSRVGVVTPEPVLLNVSLEIDPQSDPTQVLKDAQAAVAAALNPPIVSQPYDSPATAAIAAEALFDGPLLSRGFIADADVWDPRSVEELETLISQALLSTEGVFQIISLEILTPAIPGPTPAPGAAPRAFFWDPWATGNQVSLVQAGQTLFPGPRPTTSTAATQPRGLASRTVYQQWADLVPQGTFMNPSAYDAAQASLPPLYGLEKDAIDANTAASRVAQVRQLRAYLFVYEQVLANAFAQLANAPQVLSVRPKNPAYVWQPIYGLVGADAILRGTSPQVLSSDPREANAAYKTFVEDPANPYAAGMAELVTEWNRKLGQPEAFLDHLLSRFGEELPLLDWQNFETAEQKRSFLEVYPEQGLNRALAFDRERARKVPEGKTPEPKPDNTSCLEQKVNLLLAAGPREPLLSYDVVPDSSPVPDVDGDGETLFQPYTGRAYYLIEHPLLLPDMDPPSGAPFLAAPTTPPRLTRTATSSSSSSSSSSSWAPEPNGTARWSKAFFSAQLSHVLTNWTYYPLRSGFEGYVEGLIQDSTPAHLANAFLWVPPKTMDAFTALLRDWYRDGLPPLTVVSQDATTVVVRATGSAYALAAWLRAQGENASPPSGSGTS